MNQNDDRNELIYILAGIGMGAIIGAAVGLLFAPKAGAETRDELGHKLDDLRNKVQELTGELPQKLGETVEKVKQVAAQRNQNSNDKTLDSATTESAG